MSDSITPNIMNRRYDGYFMDQQIGLHGTVVSIALGVAGLAAASLFDVSRADRPDHMLFWGLWITSLLGVAIVYSGMTANVFALPNMIPGAFDMFLPFGQALMEFMLFAVLTSPLTRQLSPRSVIAVWFGCFGLFGGFSAILVRHIIWLFETTSYEPAPLPAGAFHRPSPDDRPASRPVARSAWVSSTPPAWDTIPVPSADTVIFARRLAVRCIWKVPFELAGLDSRQALFFQVKGTFRV